MEKILNPVFSKDIEIVEENRLPGLTQYLIYLKPNAERKKREFVIMLSKSTFDKMYTLKIKL